jgi:hypothetical protein
MLSCVDSHAHLADPAFDADRDAVVATSPCRRHGRGGLHRRIDRTPLSARAQVAARTSGVRCF